MRGDQQSYAGRFVGAAGFHADQEDYDNVHAADSVFGAYFVQRVQQVDGAEFPAVHGNGRAACKTNLDLFGMVRGFFRRGDPLPHGLVRRIGGIFELAAFVTEVPDVAVAAIDIFLALLHRDVVFFGVSDGVFTGIDVPFAPGRDDLQVGCDGFVGQLETDLVVALAGAAMRKSVGAEFQRDFRLALPEHRASHGGAQQISVLVDGAGAKGRPDVIAHEFFTEVFDVGGGGTRGEGFFARGFEIFLLADVADHGDHFAAVVFLEPRNDDGGVQTSGIGEDDFFWLIGLLVHKASLFFWVMKLYRLRPRFPSQIFAAQNDLGLRPAATVHFSPGPAPKPTLGRGRLQDFCRASGGAQLKSACRIAFWTYMRFSD